MIATGLVPSFSNPDSNWTLNHLASLVEWFSVRLWTKWLWVQVQLQSLKLQRTMECGFTLERVREMIRTYSQVFLSLLLVVLLLLSVLFTLVFFILYSIIIIIVILFVCVCDVNVSPVFFSSSCFFTWFCKRHSWYQWPAFLSLSFISSSSSSFLFYFYQPCL